jgi:glycosyltransferase involved in cell wall biosynthesis
MLRKGLATFVRAASFAPEIHFTVIGSWEDDAIDLLRRDATENVEFTGMVSDDALEKQMWGARVYVQASVHEGFGRSLAEAMLCECIPVVTDRGSLGEVVGKDGFYVPCRDPQATADAIRLAIEAGGEAGVRARRRITTLFGVDRRREALLQTLGELARDRRLRPDVSGQSVSA